MVPSPYQLQRLFFGLIYEVDAELIYAPPLEFCHGIVSFAQTVATQLGNHLTYKNKGY